MPNPQQGETEAAELPLVVAVVLTWNDTEFTTQCLKSVFDSDYGNLRVVLVDNGSVPPRGPELQEAFPEVVLVQNEVNQGFSGGANRGMEQALAMGADYVHLLGNDSILEPDAITHLVEAMEARPDVGAATPLLLFTGEPRLVQFYRAEYDRELALHSHYHIGEPLESRSWPDTESEFIPCVALCFRAKALREVGLMDEVFGTCWEDFDICLRFHDNGWKYLTVGDARAVHYGSYTTGRESPYITYYTTRNRLICLSRYSSRWVWLRRAVPLARSFWNQIKTYGVGNWACHKAFIHGFWDFLFNVKGERSAGNQGNIPGENFRIEGVPEYYVTVEEDRR